MAENNDTVKRCKQCGKILVSESLLGLCPKCADKDKRGAAKVMAVFAIAAPIIKNNWKHVEGLIKAVIKK